MAMVYTTHIITTCILYNICYIYVYILQIFVFETNSVVKMYLREMNEQLEISREEGEGRGDRFYVAENRMVTAKYQQMDF